MRHLNLIAILIFLTGAKGYKAGGFSPLDHLFFGKIDDVQTTDATVTVAHALTLPDPATYILTTTCEARKSDGTKREGFKKSVLVYRSGGGAVIEGNTVNNFSQPGLDYDISYGVSSNDVQIKVTGGVAETVDWRCVFNNQILE